MNHGLDTMMTRNNVKMKNGDCSGHLGTDNYCKDATLALIVIVTEAFAIVWIH